MILDDSSFLEVMCVYRLGLASSLFSHGVTYTIFKISKQNIQLVKTTCIDSSTTSVDLLCTQYSLLVVEYPKRCLHDKWSQILQIIFIV